MKKYEKCTYDVVKSHLNHYAKEYLEYCLNDIPPYEEDFDGPSVECMKRYVSDTFFHDTPDNSRCFNLAARLYMKLILRDIELANMSLDDAYTVMQTTTENCAKKYLESDEFIRYAQGLIDVNSVSTFDSTTEEYVINVESPF